MVYTTPGLVATYTVYNRLNRRINIIWVFIWVNIVDKLSLWLSSFVCIHNDYITDQYKIEFY